MFPASAATLMFAVSVIAASRSIRLLGSNTANFRRLAVAAVCLGIWAHGFGLGLGGGAFGWFLFSGAVGFGLGDFALFQAIPRLGPRLSALMINCLAAPFAVAMEWLWLGTRLGGAQLLCGAAILAGVGLSLAPARQGAVPHGRGLTGVLFGVLAGFGQGFGAVLTRRGFSASQAAGFEVDGGTAAYQRILGGLALIVLPYAWFALRRHLRGADQPVSNCPQERLAAWGWVGLNALAGPAIGVAFFQWALRTTPSGIVLPITAMTPLAVIPFTYFFEGDRPGRRPLAGGLLAVAGVVGLTLTR